jgi:hypothetical protein
MRTLIALGTLALSLASDRGLAAEPTKGCAGIWASSGLQPRVGDAYTADEIPSPNRQYVISFSEDAVQFRHQGENPIDLSLPINLSLMEVVWASNSSAFAINVSDGNVDGPWKTFLYAVPDSHIATPVLLDAVRETAKALPSCKEPANMGAIGWVPENNEVVVALETSCGVEPTRLAVRVSFQGNVLEKVSGPEIKKVWSQLAGCRLQ